LIGCGFVVQQAVQQNSQQICNKSNRWNLTYTALVKRRAGKKVAKRHLRNSNCGKQKKLEMWANAQHDGRPAEYTWRPLFNAA